MKKVRIPLITLLVIYSLVNIFIIIAIYSPDLIRNEYLAISEKFPTNVSAVFTGILGLATLALAYATFEMIISSKEQEKRDRKERRLKEIIEWATDILVCGRDISRGLFKGIVKGSTSHRAVEIEVEAKFNVISWRGVYIRHISSNLNKTLYDKVLNTQRILRQHVKIMGLDFMGKIKNASVLGKHRDTLDSSAKQIIEIAVSLLFNKS